MDSVGNSVITWYGNGVGDSSGVFAQCYNAAGAKLGAEFRVNTYLTDAQSLPCVAMDPTGNFVVTWESNGQDGSDYGVYAQRYSTGGVRSGSEFRVNTYTPGFQGIPSVACDAGGGFVITWISDLQDGSSHGIYAQRYDAAGTPLDGEFRVNTYTTGDQRDPVVATDAAGNFAIAWQSDAQDGSGTGIYAQRFAVAPLAPAGAPIVDGSSLVTNAAPATSFSTNLITASNSATASPLRLSKIHMMNQDKGPDGIE